MAARSEHNPLPDPDVPSAASWPQLTVDNYDHDAINTGASATEGSRPPLTSHISDPPALETYASPMRQHRRTPSMPRAVKETLDARVEFTNDESDGRTQHRINQYVILHEIGRGSYGAVHLATDQFGNEYAVKEFSKVRLRKRAQSHILRQGPRQRPRNFLSQPDLLVPLLPQMGGLRASEKEDALYLIREEIAIMKKLHHPNLVELIEVLDDPEEDSLYMVLEMCKKGVVMKVGLDTHAEPYSEETCRYWFRDLILGIEYLHSQGVIHRDIKPDNLLVSDDDVLKIVDFGVSEMFEKPDDMRTAKSAGSPAFLPPELCGRHGDVSGKAADIWSMGVSLFCMRYGRIPFNRGSVMEMYEAIKTENPSLADDEDPELSDLFVKILEKDPSERIKIQQLREHPWVTKNGADPLLSTEDNCSHTVEPPNELELNRAFTRKVNHLMCTMKAIHRFKALLSSRQAGSGEGGTATPVQDESSDPAKQRAEAEAIEALISQRRQILALGNDEDDGDRDGGNRGNGGSNDSTDSTDRTSAEKGQAHDVSDIEQPFLGIGTGARDDFAMDEATPDVVADSPTAVDFNVYDRAYQEAVERQMKQHGGTTHYKPTMYLTKLVKDRERIKNQLESLVEESVIFSTPDLFRKLPNESRREQLQRRVLPSPHEDSKLAHLASKIGLIESQSDAKTNTAASEEKS